MKTEELKSVKCGCGGKAMLCIGVSPYATIIRNNHEEPVTEYIVLCDKCGIRTSPYYSKAEVVEAWNTAMGERTAKVEEAVPNMTILKRKVDLQSILQAIKTDKIRVWMNYDGKICFQNTKTGNEISVEPYYDMEGNTNNE